jgi:hypothetical protein
LARDVRLRKDDSAASPLVVLTTFVVVAVLITIAVYALAFDNPEPDLKVSPSHDGGVLAFDVTAAAGEIAWGDVDVRFINRGGTDVASTYLRLPTGVIEEDDRIAVAPQPPAGLYLFQVFHEGDELVRLSVRV